MNSQQRRIERYKIIYVWKTLGKLVPGANLMLANEGEQSFQVAGPILFNCLPKEIRNKKGCGVEEFKENLDKFLLQKTSCQIIVAQMVGLQSISQLGANGCC